MNQLPQALLESLVNVPGFNKTEFCDVHASGAQVTSVRMNPAKAFDILDHFPGAEKIPWSSNGYYLPQRPSFTIDPLFHAGAYYVQEAGSMFLEEALRQTADLSKPLNVLDLCASPGGKSTLMQSIITEESLLVSNEIIKTRVGTLKDNISKWGAANVVVTNNDAKDFQRLAGFFDVIVVDAPCSGSGLFRKDNEAITEWSPENVEHCSRRQQRILTDILPALKEEGILIYSTCSYSEAEDEEIADILAGDHGMQTLPLNTSSFEGITETRSAKHQCYGYRFYPDKVKAEGFYLAAFKNIGGQYSYYAGKRKTTESISKNEAAVLINSVRDAERFSFIKQKEDILAIPYGIAESLQELQANLYIKKAGVRVGSVIREELIPAHELALAGLASEKYPSIHLDIATALDYLRKKEIALDTQLRGWTMVRYENNILGWVKILPGRINNYYPKELRILNM